LADEVVRAIWAGIDVDDWSQQPQHMDAARKPLRRLQERVNFLLKSLC
jgi:hypothetical protein